MNEIYLITQCRYKCKKSSDSNPSEKFPQYDKHGDTAYASHVVIA